MDGYDLVALVFAHEVSDPLTSLVKRIDKQLDKASPRHPGEDRHGVFVVFCNDDPGLKQKLQELAAAEGLKQVVLCTCGSAGPKRYRVAGEADLTVVIYQDSSDVTANFPLRKGDLNEDRAGEIIKAMTKVLPK